MRRNNAIWCWALIAGLAWQPGEALADDRTAVDGVEFRISGEARLRFEGQDGRFRANGGGDDRLLLSRTLVKLEADTGPVTLAVEVQDSRTYFGDDDTPLSSSIVNPVDILQAYADVDLPGLFGADSHSSLKIGRQSVSIGSKRQIERPSFANVIKGYTGAHFQSQDSNGDEFNLLLVVPQAQLPKAFDRVRDNDVVFDEEQWNRRIWGIHYRKADALPGIGSDIWLEAFVYGLSEEDSNAVPTPNRQIATPGFRVFRKPAPGQWDIDVEATYRFGSRRASSADADRTDLDVSASSLLFRLGYTWNVPWKPHLSFQYYFASGDDDPNDGKYGQYERLFGSRRTDLNNTSIFGPLTPANLSAPGVRFEVEPNDRWEARATYSAAYLASSTDSWVVARLRDPTGRSGSFIGHQIDTRFAYDLIPDDLILEFGGSALIFGDFARNVPGGPTGNAAVYAYSQVTFKF